MPKQMWLIFLATSLSRNCSFTMAAAGRALRGRGHRLSGPGGAARGGAKPDRPAAQSVSGAQLSLYLQRRLLGHNWGPPGSSPEGCRQSPAAASSAACAGPPLTAGSHIDLQQGPRAPCYAPWY